MKRITLLLPVFCITISYAQIPQTYPGIKKQVEKNKLNYNPNKLNKSKTDFFYKQLMKKQFGKSNDKLSYIFLNPKAKLSHVLPNGNIVYLLPQDNMSCIVPDMNQFNMPNVGRKIKASGMPPGTSPPHKIIPKVD